MKNNELLRIENLTKTIKGENRISNLNLTVEKGKILALVSFEIDSGKEELFDLILGKILPTSGSIYVKGEKVQSNKNDTFASLGIVDERIGLYDRLTTRQYLKYFSDLYGLDNSRIDQVISLTGLLDRQDNRLKNFNHSFKARVRLARAILHKPDLLLLDQPTVMVDFDTREILRKLILSLAEMGTGILITTSSLEEAKILAEEVGHLKKGKIISWENRDEDLQEIAYASYSSIDNSINNSTDNYSDNSIEGNYGEKKSRKIKLKRIPAQVDDKIILLDPQELTYIESYEGKSLLHSASEEFPCPKTLSELEDFLKPLGFFRSHRSYIVNMQRVREVIPWTRNSYSLILDDTRKTTVPLSKNKYKDLEEIIGL